jgi:hypothetical protein
MPIQPAIAFLVTGATSLRLSSSNVLAKPLPQTTACPVASNDVVSTVLGAPAQLIDPDFGVRVNGSAECIFTAGGKMVLVRRTGGYFSSTQATPDSIEQLRLLVADDLDYVPVQGVGNAIYWATVPDRSLAPERMGVLISQQGTDALAIGVMDTPEALGIADDAHPSGRRGACAIVPAAMIGILLPVVCACLLFLRASVRPLRPDRDCRIAADSDKSTVTAAGSHRLWGVSS